MQYCHWGKLPPQCLVTMTIDSLLVLELFESQQQGKLDLFCCSSPTHPFVLLFSLIWREVRELRTMDLNLEIWDEPQS